MRKILSILFILLAALGIGMLVGLLAMPENAQLSGELWTLESGAPNGVSQVGDYQVEWNNDHGGQLTVRNKGSRVLWQTVAGEPFVFAAIGNENVSENRGMFDIRDNIKVACTRQGVELILDTPPNAMTLSGHLQCANEQLVLYNLYFEQGKTPGTLSMSAWLQDTTTFDKPKDFNRIFLTYASEPDEHFFGFGEQFSYFDMKGKRVPIWVSEQGVGRGEQPITLAADITNGGAGGNDFTTYAPIPFYITNQMHSLLALGAEYMQFDLRKSNRVQIKTFSNIASYTIFDGNSPTEIIDYYTQSVGRMAPLPDWIISGAVVGMQGGTDKVRDVYAKLQSSRTPISAFWLQDWVGQRTTSFGKQLWWNWELDTEQYPGWDKLVADLKKDNVRVLLYINPNLVDVSDKPNARRNLFKEAMENGYLIKKADGSPYLLTNTSFDYGMLDLTNPAAVSWLQDVMRENLLAIGASGWMADFGESLPYDAVLSANYSAASLHNLYPPLWGAVNEGATSNTDAVYFMRSGYTISPGYTNLFWEGDQLVSWDEHDGIKSAVTGLNSAGLSGMAFNHSDIGGYTTITNPLIKYHRSKELLIRWMEMNAFTSIFRTHEGNQPDNNSQFYSDDETLAAFSRNAKIYAALFDYRKQLVQEAANTGLPVVRHPFIHYPDDPQVWKITFQEFMLGPDFLIAPVLDEGATSVSVYLPKGEWVHVWTGQAYGSSDAGAYFTVNAPIGQPAVFYRKGSDAGSKFVQKLKDEGVMP
jgi:alpha-glucosidase